MSEEDPELAKAKIAYQEATRVVGEQDKARDAYRTRATAVLAVGTLGASLLGFSDLESNPLFVIGLVGLGLMVGSVVALYLPWTWLMNPGEDAVERYVRQPTHSARSMYKNMADHHQENFRRNSGVIERMAWTTVGLLLGLLVLLVSWSANAVIADSPANVQRVELVGNGENG